LDCMGDGEGDKGLLSFRQSSFSKDGPLVGHEFFPKLLVTLADLSELAQIVGMIVGLHMVSFSSRMTSAVEQDVRHAVVVR